MTPEKFIQTYYPFALNVEKKTGISAIAILAQSALESGWGEKAVGNMMFGIKDTDGINGNEQLITTTEFSKSALLKFPVIISIKKQLNGLYKYIVKDYFRKYNTPEDSFLDHANFFLKNKRYAKALLVRSNTMLFIEEIAKAGYATDPNYSVALKGVATSILKRIKIKS
ncbi:glucosaminidase domain-containing protein [Flavobacterium psychrophilum]|uniref:Glucosaminidase domain-containing protein n=1 Tax=Flavobacterium psychrophilum TaxID=96345 RepID=A0A7U2NEF7_FLAPS|nr:glucosaminidase domain-containing protein [Flavobacterium psychrophilum]EKT4500936.1 glucosaminidase domain-containing protein [Flavobacterium psychrophilum]EKT4550416.1 glucosaminidase domain-containing protein [Flavobacterium psychrophilum]QRE03503.1 glucosaminidase domain-containing protein [Flavobacterium psychrophilum]